MIYSGRAPGHYRYGTLYVLLYFLFYDRRLRAISLRAPRQRNASIALNNDKSYERVGIMVHAGASGLDSGFILHAKFSLGIMLVHI